MTYLKWGLLAVAAWYLLKGLSHAYSGGGVDLGGSTTGRWAPLITYGPECYAWAPPYGVPHEGAD